MAKPLRDSPDATPKLTLNATQESSLRMGEIRVLKGSGMLRTLLGSCIGLSLYDASQRIAGLAHIVLPQSDGKTDSHGRYIDTAVGELIRLMNQQATKPLCVSAQIAGGASMFADSRIPTVGDLNLRAAKVELDRLAIAYTERDCGGTAGRRMTIDAATGLVEIELLVKSCTPRWMARLDAAHVTTKSRRSGVEP